MANPHPDTSGLIPFGELSSTERAMIATMGGKAVQESYKRKRTMRQELEIMLDMIKKDEQGNKFKDIDGNEMTRRCVMIDAICRKAESGDVRALEVIRDTVGEKPVEKQELSTGDGAFVVQFKPSLDKPIEADEWETILAEREKKQCQQ